MLSTSNAVIVQLDLGNLYVNLFSINCYSHEIYSHDRRFCMKVVVKVTLEFNWMTMKTYGGVEVKLYK
jgi:hypothetical protein